MEIIMESKNFWAPLSTYVWNIMEDEPIKEVLLCFMISFQIIWNFVDL